MEAYVKSEWDRLEAVLVQSPKSLSTGLSMLCWIESLFEGVMDLRKASEQHTKLVEKLKNEGVRVFELKELVMKNPKTVKIVEEIVRENFEKMYARESYKGYDMESDLGKFMNGLPSEFLWEILTLNPRVKLETPAHLLDERDYEVNILLKAPVGNLFFMRDQQIVTDKGLVIGRMRKPARRREPLLTELGLESLGIRPVYKVSDGFLEGGDFIPLREFALIGVGYRTDKTGAREVMDRGLEFEEVGLVYQPSSMQHMHLDTYFNVPSSSLYVVEESLSSSLSVEVFEKSGDSYVYVETVRLDHYMKKKDFNPIFVTNEEQERYATNFLTLSDGKILMAYHPKLQEFRKRLMGERIDVLDVDIREITKGYGGIHCLTCVLKRS